MGLRRARPDDREQLLVMIEEFYDVDGHDFDRSVVTAGLDPLLVDDTHGAAWVVTDGEADDVVGYAITTWGWALESGGRDVLLDEIYVRDRGRGVGGEALALVEAEAARRGATRMFLETERHNERGRAFYARHGYATEDSVWMSKELPAPRPPDPPARSRTEGVSLVAIDMMNWRWTLGVLVAEDQLRFVADHQPVALVVLAKSHVGDLGESWTPLAIAEGPAIVGVVGLADRDGVREIRHLAVDRRQQRRGIGAAAVAAIIERSRADGGISRLVLTVHPENVNARVLYENAGFVATGAERDGEPVLALDVLSLD